MYKQDEDECSPCLSQLLPVLPSICNKEDGFNIRKTFIILRIGKYWNMLPLEACHWRILRTGWSNICLGEPSLVSVQRVGLDDLLRSYLALNFSDCMRLSM